VKWSDGAKAQLSGIFNYIAQDSPLRARSIAEQLVQKSMDLGAMPRIGRVVAELGEETIRELAIYSYRIIYEIKATEIAVLAVIHKRRDVQPEEIRGE
jgi:toxin ParE1/3/4